MEPEEQPSQQEQHPLTHGYDDDLAHIMNVTDAPLVQELLTDARNRENMAVVAEAEAGERKWYSRSSLIIILLTIGVIGYGTYYYLHLTVPIQPAASVGVFRNSDSIVASSTDIKQALATYTSSATLPLNKPTLLNVVTDSPTTLLSNSQLYSFIGAEVSEPLQSVITSVRLGVVNTGKGTHPFVVASVSDPEKASKEFGIAEPTMLKMFSPALGIDTTIEQHTVGMSFQSQYFYNLPVRVMESTPIPNSPQHIILLYGYVTNNVIVITNEPDVLKAVYDNIINQQ